MNNLYKWISLLFCLTLLAATTVSCSKDDEEDIKSLKTLFMYMPWSGNLTSFFYTNISDMEESIVNMGGLDNERVIVFLSTSSTVATMFEIVYSNGTCTRETLKTYASPAFTAAEGITSILSDMKSFAPAQTYAMTIGGHGMGWVPVNSQSASSASLNIRSLQQTQTSDLKPYWEYETPLTRWFGGTSSQYRTDITTLAQGIQDAGIHMEFILFDDCYMSSIEVAYDLKEVTGYLIGSTSEIMSIGMPYAEIGEYLLGTPDYEAICEEFYNFYSTYIDESGNSYPYGTIGVTNCTELDALAAIMKEINSRYTFDTLLRSSLQRLDAPQYSLFYDYGDYVAHLCEDEDLLDEFNQQLAITVPYKKHTERYPYSSGGIHSLPISTFSGITTSDPCDISLNRATGYTITETDLESTGWYQATH